MVLDKARVTALREETRQLCAGCARRLLARPALQWTKAAEESCAGSMNSCEVRSACEERAAAEGSCRAGRVCRASQSRSLKERLLAKAEEEAMEQSAPKKPSRQRQCAVQKDSVTAHLATALFLSSE
jgi:hypothetical protein